MRNSKVYITSLVAVLLHLLLLGCIFYFSVVLVPEKPNELIIYTLEASPILNAAQASPNKANLQNQKIQLTTAEPITALPSAQSRGTQTGNAVPFIAEYPYLSRQEGEEGKVVLEYKTDDSGKVIYVKILESSTHPRLDAAAERSVKKNQFTPNTQKTLQIEFKLKENNDMDRRMNSIEKSETAIVAGGCFWGVQDIIRKIPGVLSSRVGYTGGKTANPTYPEVKTGTTGHAEAVEIIFDPQKISYETILDYFFRLHNPTTLNRQENDIGSQYRSAIFYLDEKQKKVAESKKVALDSSGKWKNPVVTEIKPAQTFYSAEDYHQDYLVKNPNGYTCHFLRD